MSEQCQLEFRHWTDHPNHRVGSDQNRILKYKSDLILDWRDSATDTNRPICKISTRKRLYGQ